ncbi:hypothetical protein OOK31_23945 [Streptomyces sp. NBC_00249]|uniref:hypothetical protein n=1 Tax=Streptomyces sp. NBC_00249 TaxID=2975690 RepID=UPI00225A622B|nr:hypothetical protein [Streptomyces sp. NBC_00249]MCX5196910.1 hypothetical protein [Streptomyces sp. NBC_00249]
MRRRSWVSRVLLQERTAGFPTVRPVTGPRPDPAGLRGTRVDVLVAGGARCHDPARVARAARAALPGARVDVLPHVSHHALPLAAAGEVAAFLAAGGG